MHLKNIGIFSLLTNIPFFGGALDRHCVNAQFCLTSRRQWMRIHEHKSNMNTAPMIKLFFFCFSHNLSLFWQHCFRLDRPTFSISLHELFLRCQCRCHHTSYPGTLLFKQKSYLYFYI